MDTTTIIMAVIAVALLVAAYLRGGDLPMAGLKAGARTLWNTFPLLLLSFAMAGLVEVLIPKELVSRWLRAEAGFRGIILGCIAGGLTPGPPYATFSVVASLYKAGAGIGSVVGFISAKSLWSASHIPTEVALLGPRVTLVRFLSTLVFPPVAGPIAQIVLAKLA